MSTIGLLFFSLGYIALLFVVAKAGDQQRFKRIPSALIYSLTLAVYCTSWTFYGAVGSAVTSGWYFLAIYLGPILVFVLGFPLLKKLLLVSKNQNVSSIADFIASRYGKSAGLSILATTILLVAIVPYIALQLKAIAVSFDMTTGESSALNQSIDSALLTAIAMAILAAYFGTQQVEASKPRRGLMLAVAFESVLKLVALVLLSGFCLYWLTQSDATTVSTQTGIFEQLFNWSQFDFSFFTQLALAACATLCLPRQFHVTVIENTQPQDLKVARFAFPYYLLIISFAVLPIAVLGVQWFDNMPSITADNYVLALPGAFEMPWLQVLVFFGGFAAATGMIVVSTLSLSTMITNDIILPYVLKKKPEKDVADYHRDVILWRRISIAMILLFAYLYKVVIGDFFALAATGLTAFSLIAQLAPALLGGLFWRGGSAKGVAVGLLLGVSVWFYFVMVPQIVAANLLSESIILQGPFSIAWLSPENFLGSGWSSLDSGVWLSLLLNTLAFVLVSRANNLSLLERTQADAFTNPLGLLPKQSAVSATLNVTVGDLKQLLERFLGTEKAEGIVDEYLQLHPNMHLQLTQPPSADLIDFAELKLAGAVGSSTARALVSSVITQKMLAPETLVNIFDETAQQLQFNQQLLQSTLESISQGISVVDDNLHLVAWNQRYIEMFDYPDGFIKPGLPVADVIRFNAARGEFDRPVENPGEIAMPHLTDEQHTAKRLAFIRSGTSYVFQRQRKDGRVFEMRGSPIPKVGYVTTYTDITEFKLVESELEQARDQLELRVKQRTEEIQKINVELTHEVARRLDSESALREAKQEAEQANQTKTQFIALASHDILQPLAAARLYASALKEFEHNQEAIEIVEKVNRSLKATESLVSTLLELARFDQGAAKPNQVDFPLQEIVTSLVDEFAVVAEKRDKTIHAPLTTEWVHSDPKWLRRILQNFVSNAIKYSSGHKVLLGVRRREQHLSIWVVDSGPGIAPSEQQAIFSDFYRSPRPHSNTPGAGLGLAVVTRLGRALGHEIGLHSGLGKGSIFYINLPYAAKRVLPTETVDIPISTIGSVKSIWYVDNDAEQLDAMRMLLKKWGIDLITLNNSEQALAQAEREQPELLLMDYDLNEEIDGIELFTKMNQTWDSSPVTVLVTATQDPELKNIASDSGMRFLAKPIRPAALRALVMG